MFATPALPRPGRLELKYALSPRGRDPIAWVLSRAPALRREHPPRRVASLYFDSARLACYEQSNAGASERVKLRLRWYGPLLEARSPVLELKYRADHLGWKSQYRSGIADLAGPSLRSLHRRLIEAVPSRERPIVEVLRLPIVITSYRRHYLATSDGRIRVTVDTELRYYDQRLRPELNLRCDGREGGVAVVECKLDPAHERDAARWLRALGPHHRFSKYCQAVGRLARV